MIHFFSFLPFRIVLFLHLSVFPSSLLCFIEICLFTPSGNAVRRGRKLWMQETTKRQELHSLLCRELKLVMKEKIQATNIMVLLQL